MEILIRRGTKGNPIMVVKFVKDSNYDPEKNEWAPRIDEVDMIRDTLNLLLKWEPSENSKKNEE
jgi:hypothetical protein